MTGSRPGRRPWLRYAAAMVVAVVVTGGVAALSRAPVEVASADEALLRLSWRMSGAAQTTCRPATPEELEGLPIHMRRNEVCDEHPPAYRLVVIRDSEPFVDALVRGRGARGDRPLVVHREIPVLAGPIRIEIRFEPEDPASDLPRFHLAESLDLEPRQVALITLDRDAGAFRIVRGARNPSSGDLTP